MVLWGLEGIDGTDFFLVKVVCVKELWSFVGKIGIWNVVSGRVDDLEWNDLKISPSQSFEVFDIYEFKTRMGSITFRDRLVEDLNRLAAMFKSLPMAWICKDAATSAERVWDTCLRDEFSDLIIFPQTCSNIVWIIFSFVAGQVLTLQDELSTQDVANLVLPSALSSKTAGCADFFKRLKIFKSSIDLPINWDMEISWRFHALTPQVFHGQGLVPRHHLRRPSLRRAGCRGAAISGGDGAATLGQQVESGFLWVSNGFFWFLTTEMCPVPFF